MNESEILKERRCNQFLFIFVCHKDDKIIVFSDAYTVNAKFSDNKLINLIQADPVTGYLDIAFLSSGFLSFPE